MGGSNRNVARPMPSANRLFALALASLIVGSVGCDRTPTEPGRATALGPAGPGKAAASMLEAGPYGFSAPAFEIAAAPDGGILVAENFTIKEIRGDGTVDVIEIPTVNGSSITGLSPIGRASFFAVSGRLFAQEQGAALWRVSQGTARRLVDIQQFEEQNDPDATKGPQWADTRCNGVAPFAAAPQSDPYDVARLSGSEALIADAAGNSLLYAKVDGDADWVAVFTPATADGSGSTDSGDWLVGPSIGGITCYVQPVPTSVAIGPDGAYYVSELTGTPVDPADLPGLARVWRIERGARHVVCPSAACEVAVSGLTSVINITFGPNGKLYVLEYDQNGWLAAFTAGAAGGAIKSCDLGTGACGVVADGLVLPGAITFDKRGDLWVLENNLGAPLVHPVELP